jgi:hypothetical protein
MTVQPFQQIVIDEKHELDDKLSKLTAFFDSPVFAHLPQDEVHRMRKQADIMRLYSRILGERISAFNGV